MAHSTSFIDYPLSGLSNLYTTKSLHSMEWSEDMIESTWTKYFAFDEDPSNTSFNLNIEDSSKGILFEDIEKAMLDAHVPTSFIIDSMQTMQPGNRRDLSGVFSVQVGRRGGPIRIEADPELVLKTLRKKLYEYLAIRRYTRNARYKLLDLLQIKTQ